MRHKLPLLFVLVAALGIGIIYTDRDPRTNTLISVPLPTTAANTVIFPTATDTLKLGQSYTLEWTPGSGTTNIFLINKAAESQGVSVSMFDRVYNIPNSGSYKYTVPKNLPVGEYKFEIGNLDSNYFEIKK